jgi:hypothetical protein
MNYTNRPIAAYTMAEFESLTSDNADFARGRGKDKKKRKSRAGLYAGIGAGAVGLAGLGAAGMRYGGAELSRRKQLDKLRKARVGSDDISSLGDEMAGRGARGRFDSDMKAVGKKSQQFGDWMGNPINKAKAAYDSSDIGANVPYSNLKSKKSVIGSTGSIGNRARQTVEAARNVLGTRAGKIGLGALAAGTVAGAGYGIYKAYKKGKKK